MVINKIRRQKDAYTTKICKYNSMTHPCKIFKSYPVYICDFPSHVVFLGLLNYFQHCWWFHNTVLFICTCVPSMCPKCAPVCQKYSIFNVKFSFSGKTCNMVRIGCVGLAKICCVPAHNRASQSTVTVWSRGKKIKVQNTITTWEKKKKSRTQTPSSYTTDDHQHRSFG